MKTFTLALALAAAALSVSPAFAASKAKHTMHMSKAAKSTVAHDSGDAAVAKLNQAQLDKIKAGK